ncbi:MAG: GMC family oxidoreductase N-terminal domain-containing protein [bacterium]|nr:GMC family oxidoreductase N-terminal domain-containing protein [bacterium]
MSFLSPKEQSTLAAICDTLVPTLMPEGTDNPQLFALSAKHLKLTELMEIGLERATDSATQNQFKQLLGLLENPIVNGLTTGHWDRFSAMPLEARTEVLRSWALSRLEIGRKAFAGIKRMALFLAYSAPQNGQPNPTYDHLGYRLPPMPDAGTRPITPLAVTSDTVLETDVLVIGSGAGGGVVAGELTEAGFDVIVVEKGEYFADHEFPRGELEANERLYDKYGAMTTADTAIAVLAGSTLGGGTTINWSGSLRPPEDVLQEWERDYGFEGVTGPEFQNSLDAVSRRMHIDTDESIPNANTRKFERGCQALQYNLTTIPRNVSGCEECGFCNFGCTFGSKQGTLKTYLQDAHDRGARILVRAHAERVTFQHGTVTGAELTVTDGSGQVHRVTVRAKAVVVAAGSIHTPALLLRSGLTNPNIGAGLRLHPTTVTTGLYDEAIYPWQGAPMTRLTADFANLDGRGYGVRLMNAPAHPGIFAFATAWLNGQQHRREMQLAARKANIIVITRDFDGGRVKVNKRGEPVLDYKLSAYDARHLMRGILESLRIHRAGGATEITGPHNQQPRFRVGHDHDFETYLQGVERLGLPSNGFSLFSAHQMASCRVSGSAAKGAIDPSGETYDVRNLFVVDGSAMPTCSGVNPMLTILGLSHFLTQRIKTRLAVHQAV